MNPSLIPYYKSAKALHLPIQYLPEIDCMLISLGKKNYPFTLSISPFNNHSSIYLAKSKDACQLVLSRAGIPVPASVTIDNEILEQNDLKKLIKKLNFPLVVKPTHGTYGGEGVLCNIKDIDCLERQLRVGIKKYSSMHVEEFYQGLKEYRILIFKNRIIGILERNPLTIVGDGTSNILQLIDLLPSHKRPESFDETCLLAQHLTLISIPEKNQTIRLMYPVNHTQGGTTHSLSKKIPRKNKTYLIKIAKLLNLELVGLDIMCEDIYLSFNKTNWLVLEANFGPDLTLHESPESGKATNVSKIILRQLIWRHPFAYLKHRLKNKQPKGA